MFKSGFGVALMFIWVGGSILGAFMNMSVDLGGGGDSASALESFLDTGSNIRTIAVDTPGAGQSSNPISTVIGYAHTAAGAMGYLANAAVWNFPFFEGWGVLVRAVFFGISAIYIVSTVIDVSAPLSFLITSLANAASGIVNAFLGRVG